MYLPELNQDEPYYTPLFMTKQERDAYRETGSLDVIRQAYVAHDNSGEESEQEKQEKIKRQLAIVAVAGGVCS